MSEVVLCGCGEEQLGPVPGIGYYCPKGFACPARPNFKEPPQEGQGGSQTLVSDAELNAWYGWGLQPHKAMRLIEEIRRLKGSLAEAEVERDHFEDLLRSTEREYNRDVTEATNAAIKAETEAAKFEGWYLSARGYAEAAQARLAAVEDVCSKASRGGNHINGVSVVRVPDVLAAARGEGDR